MNQRTTGKPRFGSVLDSGRPPEPPDIEDGDDDHGEDEGGFGPDFRIVQISQPVGRWVAKFERGEGEVLCWALIDHFCEHGHIEAQDVQGMVTMDGWDGGPLVAPFFGGNAEGGFGEFLGYARRS